MPTILINLKPYLSGLELEEKAKPLDQRRDVPTLSELADVAGMHRINFYRIANNQINRLTLDVFAVIIDELHRRGFEADISDMLVYKK